MGRGSVGCEKAKFINIYGLEQTCGTLSNAEIFSDYDSDFDYYRSKSYPYLKDLKDLKDLKKSRKLTNKCFRNYCCMSLFLDGIISPMLYNTRNEDFYNLTKEYRYYCVYLRKLLQFININITTRKKIKMPTKKFNGISYFENKYSIYSLIRNIFTKSMRGEKLLYSDIINEDNMINILKILNKLKFMINNTKIHNIFVYKSYFFEKYLDIKYEMFEELHLYTKVDKIKYLKETNLDFDKLIKNEFDIYISSLQNYFIDNIDSLINNIELIKKE